MVRRKEKKMKNPKTEHLEDFSKGFTLRKTYIEDTIGFLFITLFKNGRISQGAFAQDLKIFYHRT